LFVPLLAAGCEGAAPAPVEVAPAPAADAGREFDPATAGTIHGRVMWAGELPHVPPVTARAHPFDGSGGEEVVCENPNAPIIGPEGGVRHAVVYLRGVDPKRGRPWDHPPVRVEQADYRLRIRQGEIDSAVGFVRRGDAVEMVSTQPVFHVLHAGGAAYFSLAFPDPDQPLARRLDRKGVVELSSAAGYYWMRGHLLVDDHPYYARTDAEGRFTLPQVPPGSYQVVCWLPSWEVERHERSPDTGQVVRWFFRPALEKVQAVTLKAGETCRVEFTISAGP
jgi:hypothetical protein